MMLFKEALQERWSLDPGEKSYYPTCKLCVVNCMTLGPQGWALTGRRVPLPPKCSISSVLWVGYRFALPAQIRSNKLQSSMLTPKYA